MNLAQKRKFKLKIHKALRETLYIIRKFERDNNLENDADIEKYVKMTKIKFGDIIAELREEINKE